MEKHVPSFLRINKCVEGSQGEEEVVGRDICRGVSVVLDPSCSILVDGLCCRHVLLRDVGKPSNFS